MAREQATKAIIQVSADESVTKTAKIIRQEVDKVGDSARAAVRATDKMGGSLLTAGERAAVLTTGLAAAKNMIGTAIAAAGQFVEVLRDAGQSMAVERRFQQITAQIGGAEAAMSRLVSASAGGLDGTTLQQFAIKATTAGLSIEQLATLLEQANKAAQATGQSQKELTESFVQGLIDLSDGSFKALGLQVDLGIAVGKTAAELGVSADALSVNRKRQILLQTALAETSRAFGNLELDANLVAVNKLDAEWANLTDTITGGMAAAAVEAGKLAGIIEGRSRSFNLFVGSTWRDVAGGIGAAAVALADLNPWVDMTEGSVDDLAGQLARLENITRTTEQATTAESLAAREAAAAKAEQEKATREVTEAQQAQRKLLRETVTELARSRDAQIRQALALARTARQMGETKIAAEQYARAIDLVDKAGGRFAEAERIKREALRATRRELVESLKQQVLTARYAAEFLPDPGERQQALIEWQQLVERMNAIRRNVDETVSRAVVAAGEIRERTRAAAPARRRRGAAAFRTAAQAGATRRGRDDTITERAQDRRGISGGEQTLEKIDREKEAIRQLEASMKSASDAALSMASNMAASFGGLGASVAGATNIIKSEIDRISAVMKSFEDAGLSSSDAFVSAVPGMLSASGKLTAGFVKDKQTQAGINAAFEFAAGVASLFVPGKQAQAAGHFLAAGLYGAIAGGAFGTGGGGGAAAGAGGGAGATRQPRPADLGLDRPRERDQAGGYNVTINMTGATVVGSDRRRLRRDFAALISEAAAAAAPSGFMPA